jgi:hypothetical protein
VDESSQEEASPQILADLMAVACRSQLN